jgi:ParB family transcriptional regulator, chromosome partitioning protein
MAPETLVDVPLSDIRFDERQPRTEIDPEQLGLLQESMQKLGRTVQHITVARNEDGTFLLLSGERRVRAAQSLGWHHLPAVVVEEAPDPAQRLLRQVAENTARANLRPAELCAAIDQARQSAGPAEIAAAIGLSLRSVYNYLSILEHPHLVAGLRQGRSLRSVLAEAAALSEASEQTPPSVVSSPLRIRRSVTQLEAAWPSLDDATKVEIAVRLRALLESLEVPVRADQGES